VGLDATSIGKQADAFAEIRNEADGIYALGKRRTQIVVSRGRRPSRYLLSGGLMTCAGCGATLAGRTKEGIDYYLCGSYLYRRGAGCSACWHVRKKELEEAVFDMLESALPEEPQHLQKLVARYNVWASDQVKRYEEAENKRNEAIELRPSG
jgi:hypothetical protein